MDQYLNNMWERCFYSNGKTKKNKEEGIPPPKKKNFKMEIYRKSHDM